MQKSSLRNHFSRNSWKLASQKLLPQAVKVIWQQIFFISQYKVVLGACFGPQSPSVPYQGPGTPFFCHFSDWKRLKEWCEDTFMKEWMKALEKTRILEDIRYDEESDHSNKLKVVIRCRKKWNEPNLMYIYHLQCEKMQKNSMKQLKWPISLFSLCAVESFQLRRD